MVQMDPNIRQKMLDQGYQEDVIAYKAQVQYEKMCEEFEWKNRILRRYYKELSYYEFMEAVFGDLDKFMVITGGGSYREMDVDQLMDYHYDKNNVYVSPCSFINGCYKTDTCKDLYAFVVDIDHLKPETLQIIIENGNLGLNIPQPTFITNSGYGVHLYYVFESKIPFFRKNRKALTTAYGRLCGIVQQWIAAEVDRHSLIQPYRMPGSKTKLDLTATAFDTGEKWSFITMAQRVGLEEELYQLDMSDYVLRSQEEHKKWLKEHPAKTGEYKPKKKRNMKPVKVKKGFYERCLNTCYLKTRQGHRYMSMVGLSVVAYKSGIEKSRLEEDLNILLKHYNMIGTLIKADEVKKAMRAYNSLALKCRSTTLEQWFGWEFSRNSTKRNGRSRNDHLKRARAVQMIDYPEGEWREGNGRKSAEQQVREWKLDHPFGRKADCIRDTGLSKPTVYKWWQK